MCALNVRVSTHQNTRSSKMALPDSSRIRPLIFCSVARHVLQRINCPAASTRRGIFTSALTSAGKRSMPMRGSETKTSASPNARNCSWEGAQRRRTSAGPPARIFLFVSADVHWLG